MVVQDYMVLVNWKRKMVHYLDHLNLIIIYQHQKGKVEVQHLVVVNLNILID